MATVNDASALFKRVFGDGTIKAVPDFAKLQKEIPFSKREKLGDMYVVPVLLQMESGFSYGGHGDGAFELNASVAGAVKQAQIRGSMIVLRSQLSYEDVYKATDSGPAAFEASIGLVVDNMQQSFAKRQELAFLYGQQGLGKVASNTSTVVGGVTYYELVIDADTWAPGIWSGMKDCILEAWTAQAAGSRRQASATKNGGDLAVTAVDYVAKKVTVVGPGSAIAANDHLFFKGAKDYLSGAPKECAGLDKIISTTTGSLFNISVESYELWRGQQHAVSGEASWLAVMNAAAKATNLGLMEKAKVYLPVVQWSRLNNELAANRRYVSDMSAKASTGTQAISYYSVNGEIEIEAHPFIKESEGFLLANPTKRLMRVGASDITFRRPGMTDEIFRELVDNAGLELRAFSDQAIMCQLPAQNVKLTDIDV